MKPIVGHLPVITTKMPIKAIVAEVTGIFI
jgi:hypothetical protein